MHYHSVLHVLCTTIVSCMYCAGESIAGVVHWHRPQTLADGDSITLYEHKNGTSLHHGDPIADVYAIVARPNSCLLAVADGCGWGIKPRLAARCAVHGSIEYLNAKLFQSSERLTTHDVFHCMYRSLHSAQKCIIQHGGTTTTLCLAFVAELAEAKAGNKWGVCVVSVGDSVCYVWRNDTHQVHEVTAAIRDGKERNQRDAGGCLGADMGDHPDLTNLHCCFAPLADNDIVFLSSDGISDNFDPVTLHEATPEVGLENSQVVFPPSSQDHPTASASSTIPALSPGQRQSWAVMRMSALLKESWTEKNALNATNVKEAVTNFVIEATEEKRKFLEEVWRASGNEALTPAEKREQDKHITHTVKLLPGKLDHATIAAYKVGQICPAVSDKDIRRGHSPTHSYYMNTVAAEDHRTQKLDTYSVHGGTTFYTPRSNYKKESERAHVV